MSSTLMNNIRNKLKNSNNAISERKKIITKLITIKSGISLEILNFGIKIRK